MPPAVPVSPLLSSFHMFRAELFCFSRDILGKLPNCKEVAPRKISDLLVGLKAQERCISVQEKLPLLQPCTELMPPASFYPVLSYISVVPVCPGNPCPRSRFLIPCPACPSATIGKKQLHFLGPRQATLGCEGEVIYSLEKGQPGASLT